MTESLFPDILPIETEPPPTDDRSALVKLRDRRHALMVAGYHPLANVMRGLRLHAQAAPMDDRKALGLRCGGCANLFRNYRGFPKCELHPSMCAATDVRRWWPACVHYKPLP